MKRALAGLIAGALLSGCASQAAPEKPKASPTPTAQNITIAFGGDTHGVYQISNFLNSGGNPFSAVSDLLSSADISVVNLESAVTTHEITQEKKYLFNSNPYLLDWMKTSGIDVVNLGNNHAGDYMREGLLETLKNIEDRNMQVIGAGDSGREAWTAKTIEVRGTKVALLGIAKINSGVPTLANGELAGTTNGWDPKVIELAIKAAARQAKIVIVYTHWGVEEDRCPRKSEVEDAKAWLDWGATAVIGSHPHRQQPAIRYGAKLVDYSLGNFVFYATSGGGLESGVGTLTITPAGDVVDYQFHPAIINPNTGAPVLLSGQQKKDAISKKQRSCKSLGN
ncbi:MAG: CapA family protein [Candidatus Nanopelagicaceae bacterium]|nr:CapA family protein [Candidatus Nanopelagicaceae bacterium]